MLYDAESNILSWELTKGQISHARSFGNFIIHLSKAGQPVLIEVLNASSFIGQFDKIKELGKLKTMQYDNQSRPSQT
ncbi:MAG: DUF2283 domain-containing protein [Patescibacteria group bacterium]|jgi:hypothetical protein